MVSIPIYSNGTYTMTNYPDGGGMPGIEVMIFFIILSFGIALILGLIVEIRRKICNGGR